jgi:hypothetical protein
VVLVERLVLAVVVVDEAVVVVVVVVREVVRVREDVSGASSLDVG